MENQKLLVLGSDYVTVEVVKEAKDMGVYVIVTDLMETSPSKQAADEAWMVSTTDLDLLERKCKEESVTAIMFGASDFNIENARILCRRLGLPLYCDNDKAWAAARNKSLFKEACKEAGAPVATDYYLTDALTDAELDSVVFPVVVKPVDKSGNRGMSYCHNRQELVDAWKKARSISDNERIVVERMLKGPEYNINYVCGDGEVRLASFSRTYHQPGEASNLYSFEYNSAYHLKQYLAETNGPLIETFKQLGCREGIVWVDAMWDEQDEQFYILEMGYRFPGSMLCVPHKTMTGYSSVRWMLEVALGIQHKAENMPAPLTEARTDCAGSIHMFTNHGGIVGKIEGLEEVLALPGVNVDMPKREGGAVRDYACMGLLGIYAKDCDALCDTLKKINETLKIEDTNGENLIIRFTDYEILKKEYKEGLADFNS